MSDSDEKKPLVAPVNLPFANSGEDESKNKAEEKTSDGFSANNDETKNDTETKDKSHEAKVSQAPNGLEDIFSDTQNDEKPAAFQPVDSAKTEDWGISEAELKEQNRKKLTVLLVIFIVVVFLGVGVYWGFAKVIHMIGQTSEVGVSQEEELEEEVPLETEVVEAEEDGDDDQIEEIDPSQEINPEQGLQDETDSDRDGLSNQEEIELGTDVNKVDSDNDSLFDREEVKVYRTNPLNPDTDGDGFLDGEEVRAGYNPKGEGRLNVINR